MVTTSSTDYSSISDKMSTSHHDQSSSQTLIPQQPNPVEDFTPVFEECQSVAEKIGTDFACLHVEKDGNQQTKGFFGPQPPCELKGAIPPGQHIFAIASLFKPFVNLPICLLIDKAKNPDTELLGIKRLDDLSWNSDVWDTLNSFRGKNGKPPAPKPKGISIKECLLHVNGFPSMPGFLFAFDGTFMMSDDEFLKYAPALVSSYSSNSSPNKKEVIYSNLNTYALLLLLKEIFHPHKLSDVFDKLIFKPLGMRNTTVDPKTFETWAKTDFVVKGHRMSADLKTLSQIPEEKYVTNEIAMILFGARSCTDDLATFFRELLRARKGESKLFKVEVAKDFFSRWGTDTTRTLIGTRGTLNSNLPGFESLNVMSRTRKRDTTFKLGTAWMREHEKGKLEPVQQEIWVHYKGGTADGFTGSLYVSVQRNIFVIALSNTTGPLEFTDYACQAVLQHTLMLDPRVDIISLVKEELAIGQELLEKIENDQRVPPGSSTIIGKFAGVYEDTVHRQRLEITETGLVTRAGATERSGEMRAYIVDGKLKVVCPTGMGIEGRSVFRDVRFSLEDSTHGTRLRGDSDGLGVWLKKR